MKDNIGLLVIDVQKGFTDPYWGKRNNIHAEKNIELLLNAFRKNELPIFHAQHLSRHLHSPLHPSKPGIEFMECAMPLANEVLIQKDVNSAFIGTNLQEVLTEEEVTTLVIVGISTDHCVSTTTRMAANFGFKAYVISDAVIAFERTGYDGVSYSAETVHAVSLASLHGEFATVMDTKSILDCINL